MRSGVRDYLVLAILCALILGATLWVRSLVRDADERECEARGGHLETVHGTKYGGWTCDLP